MAPPSFNVDQGMLYLHKYNKNFAFFYILVEISFSVKVYVIGYQLLDDSFVEKYNQVTKRDPPRCSYSFFSWSVMQFRFELLSEKSSIKAQDGDTLTSMYFLETGITSHHSEY
jgi:hypothetical protein